MSNPDSEVQPTSNLETTPVDFSADFELPNILSRRSVRISAVFILFCAVGSRTLPWFRAIIYTFFFTTILTTLALIYLVCTSVRQWRASDISHHPLKNFKPFAFTSPTRWASEIDAIQRDEAVIKTALYPPSFVISSALDGLLALILREFVSSWYSKISQDPVFTNQVDKNIRHALKNIADRVLKLDLVEVAVGRIVPLLTAHMADFSAAEKAVRGKNLTKELTESEDLDLAIAAKYKDGKLHPAASLAYADPKLAQQDHLRKILEKVLPLVMPKREVASQTVAIITKELVACAVAHPIIMMLADPDFWNQWIEVMGRSTLHDRKTVQKLRQALDEHAGPEMNGIHRTNTFSRLTPKGDKQSYENFIRSIMQCHNLTDLRRLRNEVSSQLKRDAKIEHQDQTYLDRLNYAKRLLDTKVEKLADGGSGQTTPTNVKAGFRRSLIEKTKGLSRSHTYSHSSGGLEQARLIDILRSASGLSYFMEFMDRRKRISLVQFWLLVDGIRNPLEDDPDEDDDSVPSNLTWSSSDRNDITHIHQTYFSDPEIRISDESKAAVKTFLKAGRNAIPLQYWQARGAILRAQTHAHDDMSERDLPKFKKSDLFYKYLASDDASNIQSSPVSQNNSRNASRNASRNGSPERPLRRSISPIKQFQVRRSASGTNMNKLLASPTSDLTLTSRHSFDVKRPRLFDDDFETEEPPRRSLDTDKQSNGRLSPGYQRAPSDDYVVEEMEAALKGIMHDTPPSSVNGDSRRPSMQHTAADLPQGTRLFPGDSPKSSLDLPRSITPNIMDTSKPLSYANNKPPSYSRGKAPSLAALGLVDSMAAKSVFAGEELFPDETPDPLVYEEDHRKTSDSESDIDYVHAAAPGNLGLAEAISELGISISKLYAQEGIITTMLKKAELTNNTAELRILNKSKASVQREIRRKELQKQQYIVQESDNSLYGRATIQINKSIVGYEQGGKEYGIYIIEVQRKGGDQCVSAEWIVQRRYSAFWQLHQDLRAKYPTVSDLEFPRRKMVLKLQKDFLDKRRKALESYLRLLLLNAEVCRSRELRAFLSEQSLPPIPVNLAEGPDDKMDFISKLYNSIADGMEDVIGNIPRMEQLSAQLSLAMPMSPPAAIPELGLDHAFKATTMGGGELNVAEAEVELSAFEEVGGQPFVKPICDIFLEIFELNKGSSWLRGRAVIVVLHQLLGGTIERKVRDQAKALTDEESILRYIGMIKGALKPEGEKHVRTAKEKTRSKADAGVMLATLVPDMTASVVGRANAQAASRRLAAIVNNQRLNSHVAYRVLDILIDVLFPEL